MVDGVVLAGSYTTDDARRENGLLFAKGGLWVRGSTAVRLTVSAPLDTLMSWGKPGILARQVVVPVCDGSEWRVWPGGFSVNRPSTVSLLVETTQRQDTVRITVHAAVTTAGVALGAPLFRWSFVDRDGRATPAGPGVLGAGTEFVDSLRGAGAGPRG